MGILSAPITSFLNPAFEPKVRWFEPPAPHQFLADPFAVERDQTLHVFCELFDYYDYRGRIAYFEADPSGRRSAIIPVIEPPVHASYPFIIEEGGRYYCVPETAAAREVAIYVAEEFPLSWKREAVLLEDFAANDSTLLKHDDRWWLFCTDADAGFDSVLCIFYAPTLTGPWTPHARNPVKIDKASACSAGRLFIAGGQLYRPAQDCSRTYGGRIAIQKIDRLTETEFVESTVAYAGPTRDAYGAGFHTINAASRHTIVDGRRDALYVRGGLDVVRRGIRSAVRAAGVPDDIVTSVKRIARRR